VVLAEFEVVIVEFGKPNGFAAPRPAKNSGNGLIAAIFDGEEPSGVVDVLLTQLLLVD
jgi:hypothetical protein